MVIHEERIAAAIREELENQERDVAWLSRKSGIPYTTLDRRLKFGKKFAVVEVGYIAEALQIDFMTLLAGAVDNGHAAAA